jgi:hypothetical protein
MLWLHDLSAEPHLWYIIMGPGDLIVTGGYFSTYIQRNPSHSVIRKLFSCARKEKNDRNGASSGACLYSTIWRGVFFSHYKRGIECTHTYRIILQVEMKVMFLL